jgi:uncharacterized protein (DUF58 family)
MVVQQQGEVTTLSVKAMLALQQAGSRLSFLQQVQDSGCYSEGPRASRFRGHGMIFDSLRAYQPGDDPRYFDWQAFARTGKAYSKVFVQERSEAIYGVYDAGLSMQFGTRQCYKSVLAAQAAALLAWEACGRGDLVGGYCMQGRAHQLVPCQAGQAGVLAWLECLAQQFNGTKHSHAPGDWQHHLTTMLACIPQGSRVFIMSDFNQLNEQVYTLLQTCVLYFRCCFLYVQDPLETRTSVPLAWVEDATGSKRLMQQNLWQAYCHQRKQRSGWLLKLAAMGVPIIQLTTAHQVVQQLQQPVVWQGTGND